ncbi:HNH endonuclease signature motif containing protein [Kineosporia sp. R_H_3]|uniref:HNH endonuclease signature motif containing protein n=1 Tax=Kineosporia sp. R_H_3 TaxID=1961848 RepID=UPI000B4B7B4A|nr:HNH endonuclease signature motif containing protein [Kineosporia sp. R_H_3]
MTQGLPRPSDDADRLGDDDLPPDPLDGEIRLTAVDLTDCPGGEEDLQRALADVHAGRLVDEWWADPVAAQRDWDAELAALYDLVAADARRDALARRAVLDGAPGVGALRAAVQVLGGAAAWTPEQAGTVGFVDELQDGAISAFAAARRVANHALALEVAAAAQVVTAWAGRTPSLPRRTRSGRLLMDDQDVLVDSAVATELAAAAGITVGMAASRIEAAAVLVIDKKLPLTAQALEQGRLDWARLRLVLSRTRDLTAENAQTVEAMLYATRGVLDGGIRRFENALTAAILAVDADAEAKRRTRNRKGRRVSIQTTDDGGALFTAVGPGEAITAAYNGLDAAARYLRANGDSRTLDQLRHDLFVTGCTSGYLPVPADTLPIPAGCIRTGTTTSTPTTTPAVAPDTGGNPIDGTQEPSAPQWFTTTWPDVRVTVNVTVSAETLMGLIDAPGTLQGYGPIPADAIRDLVTNGVFRCLVVDGQHGTVLGVGKNTFTPGYIASDRLKLLVEHAHPTCSTPWCSKAAWRCDADHQKPFADGGPTCECNVRPLCRTCHRLKTAGLLVPEQRNRPGDPPGTTTWTTRTGRAYTALPHAPLATPRADGSRQPVAGAAYEEPPPF